MHDLEIDLSRDLAAFWLGSRAVVMNLSDLERIEALENVVRWTTGTSSGRRVPVVVLRDHGTSMIARLIVGATEGQEIVYRDGDAFNVTRGNLVVRDVQRRHRRRVPIPTLPGIAP